MRPHRLNTIAVIPCLNEARTIGPLVSALAPHVHASLVVDDGSTDDTSSVATEAGARVLRHPHPLGKGAALASGWTTAASSGALWVLLLDGDGQHAPEDAPGLFAAAASPNIQLVVGDRTPQADSMPWIRRVTNRCMSRWITSLAGVPIPDSQCGYRLVHLPSLERVRLQTRQFEIESEMIVAFARANLGIATAPIQVRYQGERSKISPIPDSIRWLRWYLASRR